ncbi:GHKL domain-containing protein [Paenibacillus oralis]|uniref:histidine kinase n=1 Tax=Paenibacillus oralis TaxID=2490856 RepID=A0A3P3TX22_9BACL|nr:HAMP domain-containing sensor histidine kinase [Paenibacillus oralis]RRJ62672.1 GHKL domain-containing protein [Paenibacillus oralis]
MFKKLRNRFLIVNLVTISVMMLVAFAAIYIITYRDVQSDSKGELHKISQSYEKPPGRSGPRDDQPLTDGSGSAETVRPDGAPADTERNDGASADDAPAGNRPPDGRFEPPPERSVSFMLLADADWGLISAKSKFDMDDEFYTSALEKAASQQKETGQFNLDGSHWIYSVRPENDGYMLVFLDMTAQQEILINLIYTFAVVGSVMLVALFFASRYFANRSIAPVKEAFEKQKQFIADASHELKTPLAIINTNADVLLAGGPDTAENQAKWLHYIKSETERMAKLTGDLLYLTQMDDARTEMLYSKFDLSEAVETIILTMEAVIFEKELSLDYEMEPNLTAYGNSEQIKQVVMILLDNAVKYAGPQGSIRVSLHKQYGEAVLEVSNTGEGIAPEHLTRIFDRFYRTDASRSRKQGGYGLGLAIAGSIVEQHRGRIYAKSTPGESTTFYVHLS